MSILTQNFVYHCPRLLSIAINNSEDDGYDDKNPMMMIMIIVIIK